MFEELLSSQNAPLKRLSLSRLKMGQGDSLDENSSHLVLYYILTGTVDVDIVLPRVKLHNVGERDKVTERRPSVVVIPPLALHVITAATAADVLKVGLADGRIGHPVLVRPSDVMREYIIGKGYYQRMVREVIGEDSPECELKCGETFNPPGLWSSWPPHDFERRPEHAPHFEECFYYIGRAGAFGREGAWGYQRRRGRYVNGETVDDVRIVRPGYYLPIPLGEHPVTAGPEMGIGYVWIYYSPVAKHYTQQADGSWLYA